MYSEHEIAPEQHVIEAWSTTCICSTDQIESNDNFIRASSGSNFKSS
jgi:hypothetical protein